MNFYKHHIGDYAAATGHLTFVEDAAFSRLLRIYYRDEKPLPVELRAVQRLAGARTDEEREAVETVLGEFFVLAEDGWHNKRADEEVAKANAQADTNRRIAEEREARKRATVKARTEHESCSGENESLNGTFNETSNDSLHDSSAVREPSQTPDSRQEQKPPIAPEGGKPGKGESRKAGSALVTLSTYLADCQSNRVEPIPADDAVWAYADAVGLPHRFVELAWWSFQGRYLTASKRYRDWRATFRNAVKGDWDRLWFLRDGGYALTTAGQQAEREMRAAA